MNSTTPLHRPSGGIVKTHILFADEQNHPEIIKILDFLIQGIQDYVNSGISVERIIKTIKETYRNMLAYNVAANLSDGSDPKFNEVLLRDLQATFVLRTLDELYYNGNQTEGYERARLFSLTADDCFVYYNAKYHYANLELQEIGRKAFEDIAKNEGLHRYHVQELYGFLQPFSYDFNSRWEHELQDTRLAVVMRSHFSKPPKDLILYYSMSQNRQCD